VDTNALRQQARKRRKALRWGQDEVARQAGVSLGTVQNFELGKSVPQPENLASILRVLNINPADPEAGADDTGEGNRDSLSAQLPTWPMDVDVFLNMMGTYLVQFPEEQRRRLIYGVTRQIFSAPEPNG
jgi:transcriptional regulator with XRE-family HTH domain